MGKILLEEETYAIRGAVFGSNMQTANFTDLSDPIISTWSWRKRKAGTTVTHLSNLRQHKIRHISLTGITHNS